MAYRPPLFESQECVSTVDLRIKCRDLLDKDLTSKSDPCAVLYQFAGGQWRELGRTENIKNCLNPEFSTAISVKYYFEEVQKIKVAIYDIDNTSVTLDDDDFLGQTQCTLGQLVSSSPLTRPLLLKNEKHAGKGTITLQAEERVEGGEKVYLSFKAKKLDNKDFLGKSDPYLEILKENSDGSFQVVHRTEVVKNNLNPTWRQVQVLLQTLCSRDKTKKLKIICHDWDSDGSHDLIGSCETSVKEMEDAANGKEISWPCVNPKKKAKKKSYKDSGTIILTSCKVVREPTFLEYIFSGMQINFTVGVDFTGSNGNPRDPTSLHYINPYQPNEYMQAITAVGHICQDYDTDKLFPALGFGAKIPPNMTVSHEFPINFNYQNPFCAGIEGILAAYQNCITQIQLYGPTNAAPVIYHVAKFALAAQQEEPQKGAASYFILLMLTDGELTDMNHTREAIVYASSLPMSLIIVGVGEADFTNMNILDGDDGMLRSPAGVPVKRDIVQFVPFREFKKASSVELARHVLAEVPKQVTEYFGMRGLMPLKPPALQT